MKGLTIIIGLLISFNCYSNNDLKKIISKGDTATSYLTFEKLAQETNELTPANNKNWLFYYWGAFNFAMSGYLAPRIQKDLFLDKADVLIAKGIELNPNEPELFLLQSWVHSSRISVAPASRAKTYGIKSNQAQEKACELSPNNPRCAFMQGASLYHTPPAMGGGKLKAKPFFEKSVEQFSSFAPASDTHPNWGKQQAVKYLESYK